MAPQLLEGTVADRPRSEAIRKPRAVWPSNPVAALWDTMVGKKIVMAATGVVLVGFVIAHMLGNLKVFLGAAAIDTYAAFLRTMGEPLFPYRSEEHTSELQSHSDLVCRLLLEK